MDVQLQVLSEAERELIHAESLRILSEVGVRFHGDKALGILETHGAKVSREHKVARIPQELVSQALATAPKSFVLQARNPDLSYRLPSVLPGYGMDGTCAFAVDFETGERRYGTTEDIRNALRVFQALDLAVMAWSPTCASDKPANARPLHEFFAMLRHCSKHGQHELHRVAQVPYLVAGLKAILGSEDAIKAKKICSLIYCPVSPLVHDGQMLDAYLELGEFELPVMIMPMPVTGTTGPASLFSNICLANAETLSAIVVFQLAHPGRQLIYSDAVGTMDFATGGFLAGAPETALQATGLVTMGRHYNLPTTSTGCSADAKEPGAQAVLEKLLTTLPCVLAGSDMIVGVGLIECSQTLVLEQIVVDNEIGHLCQRIRQGIDTGEQRNLFADIAQAGPGGNFLKSRSTRQAARSGEFSRTTLADRQPYEAWVKQGMPSIYTRAREKVQAILAAPQVDPLPESVSDELDEILRAADRDIPTEAGR